MTRFLAQALVIARRDFTAIVLTPTFLIFLLAPLFMLLVGMIGGMGAARVLDGGGERAVALVAPGELNRLREADRRLRRVVGTDPGPPPVSIELAGPEPRNQARALLSQGGVSAVLYGAGGNRAVLRSPAGARDAEYLALVAAAAAQETRPRIEALAKDRPRIGPRERGATAFAAVFAMFFLTLLLAGQSISMLAEERTNKVIEILAAAAPLEAVFLGKLIGMLGVALLFIGFWAAIGATAAAGLGGFDVTSLAPAIGLPAFAALFLGYFVLAFLLLSAVFLGVGAQASTPRELQMLSLPITIFQVGMFALASAGAGDPRSTASLAGAIFPFSSPFAMIARAAAGAPAWQHAAAILWQLLWLTLTVTIAARLFRRGVLKSGGVRG